MSVRKFLDVSTAHVTPGEMARIEDGDGPISARHNYGAWLYVPDNIDDGGWPELEDGSMPNLRRILDLAKREECAYVLLDADAPTHPSLPSFDW